MNLSMGVTSTPGYNRHPHGTTHYRHGKASMARGWRTKARGHYPVKVTRVKAGAR